MLNQSPPLSSCFYCVLYEAPPVERAHTKSDQRRRAGREFGRDQSEVAPGKIPAGFRPLRCNQSLSRRSSLHGRVGWGVGGTRHPCHDGHCFCLLWLWRRRRHCFYNGVTAFTTASHCFCVVQLATVPRFDVFTILLYRVARVVSLQAPQAHNVTSLPSEKTITAAK